MTETEDPPERADAHLRDLPDGCGCAEVWEHTSTTRLEGDAAATGASDADDPEAVEVAGTDTGDGTEADPSDGSGADASDG